METLGYYLYNQEEGKVFVSRHGTFLEKEFLIRKVSGRMTQLEKVQDKPLGEDSMGDAIMEEPIVEPVVEEAQAPRQSEMLCNVRNVLLLDDNEPLTYAEAMVDLDSKLWLEAMKSELKSMDDNQVWNLVDLPNGARTIECKWIITKKTYMDGNVQIHKAWLVTKGFWQVQGIDYNATFSHVAMLKSVRIILAIAANFDYEIWQMDVKTAFLNENLIEDVYMIQPEGFVDLENASSEIHLWIEAGISELEHSF